MITKEPLEGSRGTVFRSVDSPPGAKARERLCVVLDADLQHQENPRGLRAGCVTFLHKDGSHTLRTGDAPGASRGHLLSTPPPSSLPGGATQEPQLCKAKEYNRTKENKPQNGKLLPVSKMEITTKLTSKN